MGKEFCINNKSIRRVCLVKRLCVSLPNFLIDVSVFVWMADQSRAIAFTIRPVSVFEFIFDFSIFFVYCRDHTQVQEIQKSLFFFDFSLGTFLPVSRQRFSFSLKFPFDFVSRETSVTSWPWIYNASGWWMGKKERVTKYCRSLTVTSRRCQTFSRDAGEYSTFRDH